MLTLLPILNFFLFSLNLMIFRRAEGAPCWRRACLKSAVSCFVFVLLSTELLSVFCALTKLSIVLFWSLFLVINAAALWRSRENLSALSSTLAQKRHGLEIFVLSVLGVILVVTAINAIVAPTNNWDSMTYHMPRVMHWIQNTSVNYYPVNDLRQLSYPPLAEYAIMHLQMLSNSDRFANLVQWFCLLMSVIAVSLIAQRLGAGRKGQFFASLLCATIPMNILQATSTQNNIVFGFFLAAFVFFCLELVAADEKTSCAFWAALALGCALNTKGLALMLAVPFLFFLSFSSRIRWTGILRWGGLFLLVLGILLAGTITRNSQLYHRPFPTDAETSNLVNREIDAPSFFSNLTRNAALHLATPSFKINRALEALVEKGHAMIGIDIADPRYSFGGHVFRFAGHNRHEDHAGNLFHFLAFTLAAILWVLNREQRQQRPLILYFCAVLTGILIFCFSLKWQPWHSRLHLPFFILFAPFAAAVISEQKNKTLLLSLSILSALFALPWLTANESRPLTGGKSIFSQERNKQYFANNPGMFFSYRKAADEIIDLNCNKIGLAFAGDSWEYPLWPLLKDHRSQIKIRHVNVKNISSGLSGQTFDPCVVLCDNMDVGSKLSVEGKRFVRSRRSAFLSTYLPDPTGELAKRSLLFHLNRTLEFTGKINRLLSSFPSKAPMSADQLNAMVTLRRLQLIESESIDPDDLDAALPGFGPRFKSFQKGLRMTTEGFAQRNQWAYQEGQKELRRWDLWFQSHIQDIKQAFGD